MLALAIEIIKYSAEKTGVITDDEVCDIIRRSDDNPEAFAEIIDSFSPLVHTVISGMFDRYRKADLDDAVSDTFLRLWKSRRTYDKERGSYANYVVLNARASAVSMLGKFYREKEFIFEYGVGDLGDVAEDNVEQEVFSSFDSETVRNVISALPDDDRELIVCKYFYMMRVRDIAKRTRRSEKSVEARLYKLRVQLRGEFTRLGINGMGD